MVLYFDEILTFALVGLYDFCYFYLFFLDIITLTWVASRSVFCIPIFMSTMGFKVSFKFLLIDRV